MRVMLLAVLWLPWCALAQESVPYFDLSDGWTLMVPGQPERTVRLPFSGQQPAGRYSLRRDMDLPAGVNSRDLALLLPRLHGAHRVEVNGRTIGTYGDPDSWNPPMPASRAYPLAATEGASRLRIEVHVVRRVFLYSPAPPPGPDFPLLALAGTVENERRARVVGAAFSRTFMTLVSASSVVMGLIVLLLARQNPSAEALHVLSVSLFASAAGTFLSVTGTVWAWPGAWTNSMVWGLVVSFAQAATAEFGFRLAGYRPAWRWPVYVAWVVANVLGQHSTPRTIVLNTVPPALAALCLYRVRKRVSPSTLLVLWIVLAFQLANVRLSYYHWAGIYLPPGPLARVVLYLGLVVAMLRRAGADRAERERLATELSAARQVQHLLVGGAEAAHTNFQVETAYQPAQEVGGDFYLVESLESGALLAVVGDVSGKGLKAAMVVSLIIGAVRNRRSDRPAEILTELNRVLAGQLDGGFVTCIAARVESSGESLVANAGHIPPYGNGQELAVVAGLPLGIVGEECYEESRFTLSGALTLVSDGVVEAANAAGELFGFERTCAISMEPAQEIAEAAKQWGQNDDITVVTVRRMG